MPQDEPAKGFPGSLRLEVAEAKASAQSAWTVAVVATSLAGLSIALTFIMPGMRSPSSTATDMERRMASMRQEMDAMNERSKATVAAIEERHSGKEIKASQISVSNGIETTVITPFGMSVGRHIAGQDKLGFVLVQDNRGAVMAQFGNAADASKVVIRSDEPSVTMVDGDGNDRSVLGVAHTVLKKDGATTKTSPANLTFFDKDGNVTLGIPVR
jgi:hypothetical protein